MMRFRIRCGVTAFIAHPPLKKGTSLQAPIRNLFQRPYEILCQAQNDKGYDDEIPCQARDDVEKVMRTRINRKKGHVIAGADPQSRVSS